MATAKLIPALLAVVSSLAYIATASAAYGIGMSGSLSLLSPLDVPQGSIVSSDSLFVVVYSYAEKPVRVKLAAEAPPGINVTFVPGASNITLMPGESRRFRVVLNVSKDLVPGNYTVYVKAYILRGPGKGAVIVPGIGQRLVLRVHGEYSEIHVEVKDPGGSIASRALVRLYRKIKGKEVSIADAWGGVLDARVIPGNYVVRAYLAGELAAEKAIHLEPRRRQEITLEAKVLYIERFTARLLNSSSSNPLAIRIHLVIKNIYNTIRDATILLNITHNGVPLELREIASSSTIPPGRSEYTLDYVPPGGLKEGQYQLQVVVKAFRDKVIAASAPARVTVPGKTDYRFVLAALVAPIAVLLLSRHRRKNRQ